MILYIFLSSPAWALACALLLILIMIALGLHTVFKNEKPPFKEVELCHFLMDGMKLKEGDTIFMDETLVVLTKNEAEILTNGGISCAGIRVIKLA